MKYPDVQNMIDILKAVDNSPQSTMGFDMNHWYYASHASRHPCGSACCIGGWASYHLKSKYSSGQDAFRIVCKLDNSDDSREISMQVCCPLIVNYSTLTLEMAIEVLEILRDTGEVKWQEVYERSHPKAADAD